MNFKFVYFLGIGGIGMSALARYFIRQGVKVAGYDRTPSPLTGELTGQGAEIHYRDDVSMIPGYMLTPKHTLVIYTPAIPNDMAELNFLKTEGYRVVKRSEALGYLSRDKYVMAVAGTHGKTTTTTLVAWLNHVAGGGGSAFLGGISRNFDSNMVAGNGSRLAVEADEYDRSFLQLNPDVAVITSVDADHLDIYGTVESIRDAFRQFVAQIKPGGTLIIKLGVELNLDNKDISIYRYSYSTPCDFYARNIALEQDGLYRFDIVTPCEVITGCKLGIPGWINVENAVAAVALLWSSGFDRKLIHSALESFRGVKRRFEIYINTPELVYIDDYAHHPDELRAAITSLREIYRGREITAIFQPHLYTRTRDFHKQFGDALSLADRVVLLPIYPARELPIEGITSQTIARHVTVPCQIVQKEELCALLERTKVDVVATFGAGDIDRLCDEITKNLLRNCLNFIQ